MYYFLAIIIIVLLFFIFQHLKNLNDKVSEQLIQEYPLFSPNEIKECILETNRLGAEHEILINQIKAAGDEEQSELHIRRRQKELEWKCANAKHDKMIKLNAEVMNGKRTLSEARANYWDYLNDQMHDQLNEIIQNEKNNIKKAKEAANERAGE